MAACISSGALAVTHPSTCVRLTRRGGKVPRGAVASSSALKNGAGGVSKRRLTHRRALGVRCRAAAADLPDGQRVVITGAGVVSTAGNDVETFFDSLLAGKSGVVDLTQWAPGVFDDLPTRIGAPIQDLAPGDDLTAKEIRRMDKVHQYAVCAGKRALRHAGLWVRRRTASFPRACFRFLRAFRTRSLASMLRLSPRRVTG